MRHVTLFEFRFSPFFEVEQVFNLLKWYCNKCKIENEWSLHVIGEGSERLDSAAWNQAGALLEVVVVYYYDYCADILKTDVPFFSFCKYFALALFITRWMLFFVEYIYYIYKNLRVCLEVRVRRLKAGSSVCFCWNGPQGRTHVCKREEKGSENPL